MAFDNLKNMISGAAGASVGGKNAGQAQTGYLLYTLSGTSLGVTSTPFAQTNIKAPNGYALSNLNLYLSVSDLTGNTTAPVSPTSIETTLQQFQIVGRSGKPIVIMNGAYGELTRWQQLLNDSGIYVTTTAPTESVTTYNDYDNLEHSPSST